MCGGCALYSSSSACFRVSVYVAPALTAVSGTLSFNTINLLIQPVILRQVRAGATPHSGGIPVFDCGDNDQHFFLSKQVLVPFGRSLAWCWPLPNPSTLLLYCSSRPGRTLSPILMVRRKPLFNMAVSNTLMVRQKPLFNMAVLQYILFLITWLAEAAPRPQGQAPTALTTSSTYWLSQIPRQGSVAFGSDTSYQIFRNVKDYGAVGMKQCSSLPGRY